MTHVRPRPGPSLDLVLSSGFFFIPRGVVVVLIFTTAPLLFSCTDDVGRCCLRFLRLVRFSTFCADCQFAEDLRPIRPD